MMELDYEDKLCALSLSCTPGVGPVTVRRLMQAARREGIPLAELLSRGADELERQLNLGSETAGAVGGLEEPRRRGQRLLQQAGDASLQVLFDGQSSYPSRLTEALGKESPPVLFVKGHLELLQGRTLAVVGSRDPTGVAARAAETFVEGQGRLGLTIVSGGARGIDTIAHCEGLKAGSVAVVPACGIRRFRWRGSERISGEPQGWCVVGQFPPDAPWRTRQAMMRNRAIVALSDAVVAFEPRDRGGTWHSSGWALRLGKPLFVVTAARSGPARRGMKRLARRGAVRLDESALPQGEEFWRMVEEFVPTSRPTQSEFSEDGECL